jgi:hypothetical protein
MDIQSVITVVILIAAVLAAVVFAFRKVRSFQPGPGCADDCGCSSKSKSAVK